MGAQRAGQPSDDLRKVRFGQFVLRILSNAKDRGLTMKQIEDATGIGKSTIYRWRDGTVLPKMPELRRFCEGLGAPINEAYAALGWSEDPERRQPEPLLEDPDVRALMRKLTDPQTPAATKLLIRRTIRALVGEQTEQ